MNREIKFRGLREDGKGWAHGSYIFDNRGNHHFISYFWEDGQRDYIVIPETVGQFTGLHDKNGKEIYSGDIVREKLEDSVEPEGFYNCDSVVEMVNGCWVLSEVGFDYSKTPMSERNFLYEADGIEIIGNINENKNEKQGAKI